MPNTPLQIQAGLAPWLRQSSALATPAPIQGIAPAAAPWYADQMATRRNKSSDLELQQLQAEFLRQRDEPPREEAARIEAAQQESTRIHRQVTAQTRQF